MNIVETVRGNRARYDTDKIDDGHHYEGVYQGEMERLAKVLSDGGSVSIMEIGVLRGGSVRLWGDLLPGAHIDALDIVDRTEGNLPPGAVLHIGDAYAGKPQWLCDTYDLIIDDGPHTVESQIACIRLYADALKSDGRLLVEDVQGDGALSTLVANVPNGYTFVIHDIRKTTGRPDDIILEVYRKGGS